MAHDIEADIGDKQAGLLAALNAAAAIKAASLPERGSSRKVGRVRALADLLNITSSAVSGWSGEVPLARVIQIESLTGVPRYVLRPDCWHAPASTIAIQAAE